MQKNDKPIIRLRSFLELKNVFPNIYEAIQKAKDNILDELSREGIASSLTFGETWIGDKKKTKKAILEGLSRYDDSKMFYEDHPHESTIRLEFRVTWAHEEYNPMGHVIGATVRATLKQIKGVKDASTMFGHYGIDVSSQLVYIQIERK